MAKDYEVIGHVGVETGILLLADPCNIIRDDDWDDFIEESGKGLNENGLSEAFGGLMINTLNDNGLYPIEVIRNDQGRIIEIRIQLDS